MISGNFLSVSKCEISNNRIMIRKFYFQNVKVITVSDLPYGQHTFKLEVISGWNYVCKLEYVN